MPGGDGVRLRALNFFHQRGNLADSERVDDPAGYIFSNLTLKMYSRTPRHAHRLLYGRLNGSLWSLYYEFSAT